jgi:serine/threonine protein kinase
MDSANLDTPPATPSPPGSAPGSGKVIAERYRLVKKLGEGAMGAVFLAEHIHMRKRFALKILHAEAMASPEIVARFEREAVAAGNIAHPGVCAATDFGRLPDGGFFLVLEYVEGDSLRATLRKGPLGAERGLEVARQILAALGAAHAKGVVHRDMKPENVMLQPGDVVKVLDFGIAKVDANTLGESQGTNLTRMGAIYGTPVYMAPEQAMGKEIDHRVDLYAVGIMLHEMIVGAPPFDGDGIVILAKHVNDPPPPIDRAIAPAEVEAFVHRLLAKKANERPADAAAAIAELEVARRAMSAFSPAEIATSPTVMGTESSYSGVHVASAATVMGEGSPTPPPVSLRDKTLLVRDRALRSLSPLAKRVGVDVKHLAIAIACLAGMFVILLCIVLSRPSADADEAEAKKPRRRSPATAAAPTNTAKDDDKSEPASSPSGSSSGKGSGGIKGIGRKIKSLF